ncbi:DNA cytosine methyltransferase [Sulfuricurvum sp.]|uniref:DNA cytosine methyltransferase n=1 Tax=Sulfuricurvum sp. TaxID=2025608 RepID=UPI002E3375DE|nr:DNA cytosine methyltransferase [Sulfuricurvum sp.]HEX5330633.1 DNA cytosine methyltransferase [Sulfuricurvum sp.]
MINIVDLFSGAGGLTFGFYYKIKGQKFVRNKKFNFLFANEYNPHACEAFRLNFPDIPLIGCDIASITPAKLEEHNIQCNDVDLVIGGPPCQSYSTVGKRQYDQRATMYEEYIRLLGILRPKMFIFENVTGLLSMKNENGEPVINDIKKLFGNIQSANTELGYVIKQTILNAKDFGVPQSRERVFLVGTRKDLKETWSFPKATHGGNTGKNFINICEAISDLPHLNQGETKHLYENNPNSTYEILMRNGSQILMNHTCSVYGEKMTAVIQAVPQGEGRHYINSLVEKGILKKEYYLTSGYNNTYGRLWWDKPSTTITNSFGTPSALRCIHPLQDRALTTREGARLQSFPDWFKFVGPKHERNSQIGNAVPPLLAIQLANSIEKSLSDIANG